MEWATGENSRLSFEGAGSGTNVGLSGRSRAGAGEGVVKRDGLPDEDGWQGVSLLFRRRSSRRGLAPLSRERAAVCNGTLCT